MSALALLAMLLFGSISIEGNASAIYDWEGECTFGCTGEATARFELTDPYVPGTRFDSHFFCATCPLVTVSYSDDVASFAPNSVDIFGFAVFPVNSGPGLVRLFRECFCDNRWFFNADGTWETIFETNNVNIPNPFHQHFASGVEGHIHARGSRAFNARALRDGPCRARVSSPLSPPDS